MRLAICAAAMLTLSAPFAVSRAPDVPALAIGGASMTLQIPRSMQIEHDAIHGALADAVKAPDPVGRAAGELAAVLHPHLVREEQIALPPLGLLASLASTSPITLADSAEALKMTDALRREMPRMLEEHKRIRAAVQALRAAARSAGSARFEELADRLSRHAQTEEEVLYPAAVLVGELVRGRMPQSQQSAR